MVKILIVTLAFIAAGAVGFALLAIRQKATVEREKSSLASEIKKYEESSRKLSQQNQKISEELEEAKSAKDKIQAQLSQVDVQIDTLSSERDNWKNRVDNLKEERNQLVGKIEDLEKKLAEAQAEAKAAALVQIQQPAPVIEPPVVSPAPTSEVPTDQYWADILKEKASLEVTVNDFKQRLSMGLIETEELKKKNVELEAALGQLKSEKEEIERKIKYNDDLANNLSVQLYKEKDDKKFLNEKLEKIQQDTAALRLQVKELSESKIALEKSIIRLTEDKAGVERKLSQTQGILQERTSEVLGIKEGIEKDFQGLAASAEKKEVELSPIVVRVSGSWEEKEKKTKPSANKKTTEQKPAASKTQKAKNVKKDGQVSDETQESKAADEAPGESESPAQESPVQEIPQESQEENASSQQKESRGSVISVNPKDGFIIVNIGEDTGIQAGDTLGIYRGKKHISDVSVLQVRKNVSAADLKDKNVKIKVGDIVK